MADIKSTSVIHSNMFLNLITLYLFMKLYVCLQKCSFICYLYLSFMYVLTSFDVCSQPFLKIKQIY